MIMPTVKTRIFALGCLFALASAPVVQTVAQNGQYIYDVQDGEADIFGQLRYEKNVNGTGLVKLNTTNPNGYQWVRDYGYQAGVTPITTAGTYVGSEYYAYETTLYANTLMPRAISVVDVNTGEYTTKREIVNSTTEAPLILDEMTYDPKTNRIFGLHYDTSANKSYIYEIDRKTLDIALVATIDKVLFYTLAADNGSLYAVRKGGMKSYLSKIDISSINKTTKTCEYSDLGNTNIYLGDFSQTMEFDKTTHRLWWMAQTSDGNAYLVELNPQTGAQIKKEFIDNEMQLLGMGIPYQYVADGAPSYPRAFKATADAKGALSAQLSWTTPSVSYLGAKLSALTGTKVYRNDQLVYTSTETTQGKSVAWTDRTYDRINKVKEFSQSNYARAITIDMIANHVGMNRSSFCTFFKKATGQTYITYLNKLRVDRACYLLREGKFSITEVCYMVGFNDVPYFNRCFKNNRGMSPKDYADGVITQRQVIKPRKKDTQKDQDQQN